MVLPGDLQNALCRSAEFDGKLQFTPQPCFVGNQLPEPQLIRLRDPGSLIRQRRPQPFADMQKRQSRLELLSQGDGVTRSLQGLRGEIRGIEDALYSAVRR